MRQRRSGRLGAWTQAEAAVGPELASGWWGLLGSGCGWQVPEWAQLRHRCLGEVDGGRVGPEWPVQTPVLPLQVLTYRPSWENQWLWAQSRGAEDWA